MKAKIRSLKTLKSQPVVSSETKTHYYKKGETVVIHSTVPFVFDGCSRDRIYKYERIDHALGHSITEFKEHLEHPIEWIVTINALYDLKIKIEHNYVSQTLKLSVIYLLNKSKNEMV